MESNENVMKRNGSLKFAGKIMKRDEIRPTILLKPQSSKNLEELNRTRSEIGSDSSVKTPMTIIRPPAKKDDQTPLTTKPVNGYTQHKTLQGLQPSASSQSIEKNIRTPPVTNTGAATASAISSTPLSQVATSLASQGTAIAPLSVRLNTGPFLNTSVKLLDENLVWQEQLQEYLHEQPDFLVVGIIGKQGAGKSTLMSLLAGNKFTDENRHMIFKQSGKDTRELAQHKTSGIQAFVTTERTILLDVQPLLSSSVLERAINHEKKHSNYDFKYYENFIELQSIELACFVLSVCDVVIVLEDWFTDPNLFRLIQTAEMLTPNMHTTAGTQDDYVERHPHMIYVLNKSEYISKSEVSKMKTCVDHLMKDSKLTYKGSLCEFRNHLNRRRICNNENTNFLLLPKADGYRNDWHNNMLPVFNGLPSLETSIKYLQREILGVKRNPYTSSSLFTEKKWFTYANKVWDTIKKSSMISEYNRLMT